MRKVYGICGFAGLCLALVLPAFAWAEPPALSGNADVLHELLARQTLLHDSQLAPLNLGVRVHDHVAVLWGPVPTAALERRAVAVLQQIPELIEVRDELQLESSEETAPGVAPVPPLRLSPITLPSFPEPGGERKAKRTPPAPPDRPRTPAPSPGVLTKHSAPLPKSSPSPIGNPQEHLADADGPLLPAIAIPGPKTGTSDDLSFGEWLIEAATRVQRSEPRFRQLRVEVRGRTVRLDGAVERWADAYDLAERIRQLAGVERVVLGDIHTEGASR